MVVKFRLLSVIIKLGSYRTPKRVMYVLEAWLASDADLIYISFFPGMTSNKDINVLAKS